eukprot:TRINITY_DN7750_c0_g1_i2.p1 TRINITY_DN7750_c0_g1~~TRINITY_DN7750_c0_g1_i2.p1  ORF type:complete len:949 (-),score=178.97 TRINITY_DN7750_c0_g1_i2:248-3094(-)
MSQAAFYRSTSPDWASLIVPEPGHEATSADRARNAVDRGKFAVSVDEGLEETRRSSTRSAGSQRGTPAALPRMHLEAHDEVECDTFAQIERDSVGTAIGSTCTSASNSPTDASPRDSTESTIGMGVMSGPLISIVPPVPTQKGSEVKRMLPRKDLAIKPKVFVTPAPEKEVQTAHMTRLEQAFAQRRSVILGEDMGKHGSDSESRECTPKAATNNEDVAPFVEEVNNQGDRGSILSCDHEVIFSRLEMPVLYLSENPINFQLMKKQEDESSSGSPSSDDNSGVEDSDEEEWNCRGMAEVEVPIWLMDRLKASGHYRPPGAIDDDGERSRVGEDLVDIREEDENERDQHSDDEQLQTPTSNNACGNFWKIPIPTRKNSTLTRKNSVMFSKTHSSRSSRCDDSASEHSASESQVIDKAAHKLSESADNKPKPPPSRSRRATIHVPQQQNPRSRRASVAVGGVDSQRLDGGSSASSSDSPGGVDSHRAAFEAGTMNRRSRRPSMLGIFSQSQGNASQEGLYAVAKQEEKVGELVEVRRGSLVLSTSMMEEILRSKSEKVGRGPLDGCPIEDLNEEDDDEIILPLCSAPANRPRGRCMCKVHPVTGVVVHTCMTPSATTENTLADTSYICTEWSSRRGTINSRRGSTQAPFVEDAQPFRKRIRNASMLATVGGTQPKANGVNDFEEEQEEDTKENELAVSYSTIKSSRLASCRGSLTAPGGSDTLLSSASFRGDASSNLLLPTSTGGMTFSEEQVEAELGHRFDLIEPQALAAKMHDPELLIVDVRGRDWVGGHIPYSINLRTSEVLKNPGSLLSQCRRDRIHTVVFTCMYSVLRARKCAAALDMAQHDEQKAGHAAYRIKTLLLGGGMHAYVNHFAGTSSTTVNVKQLADFAPSMWTDGGPSQGGLVHVMDAMWSSGGQKALSDALTQELSSLLACSSRRSTEAPTPDYLH